MLAIHLICRRDSHGLMRNLMPIAPQKGHYRSGYWDLSREDAEALVGGWLYLHGKRSEPSAFGGRVLSWRTVKHEASERIEFYIAFAPPVRGQRWRGLTDAMAWSGGLVPADLDHERVD